MNERGERVAPARLVGFILLGVAVVAVGSGILALTSGNGTSAASGSPNPVPTQTASASPTSQPTTTSVVPPPTTTSYPSGQTTTIAPPPPLTTTMVPAAGPALPVMVRVYNNGTIKGLANRAADDFRAAGYDVVEVGNYSQSQGIIGTTTVYYSPASGEQQVAEQLGKQFGMRVAPRFPGIAYASPGVVVIVTNDFHGR